MDETLTRLIDMMEDMAPEIWETALKQATANGISILIWALFCFIFVIVCLWFTKWSLNKRAQIIKNNENTDNGWGRVYTGDEELTARLSSLGAFTFFFTAIALSISGAMHLINPEYYAIKLLLELL